MNPIILNREFQHPTDGWYMIEPKGEHLNRASQIVQVIDDSAAAAIVNGFNADAARPDFAGMLIDHEHFKHDKDKETRAYGWLTGLQNREDGIYGQVRWTQTGRAAVDGGDYRFFSTEYDPADLKVLNAAKVKRVRPVRLDGLTLTNDPNNEGGRPITNRRQPEDEEFRRAEAADKTKGNKMKSVATLLGLSADASEEAVHAEVLKIKNRATSAEEKIAPLETKVTELTTANGTLLDEQIAADLDANGVKDEKIRNRVTPLLKTMKNRADRVGFLTEVVGKPAATTGKEQTKLHNRDTKPPGQAATEDGKNGQAEQVKATKIMNRASALRKEMPNLSLATSTRMAQNEIEQEA